MVGVAVNVTLVPGQIVVADADTETAGTGAGVTVMAIGVLVALTGEAQGAFEVITTVTLSPLLNVADEKVELLLPTLTPFTLHWYCGLVPPLTGVAVKLIVVPGQVVVAEAATLTDGIGAGVTVIGMPSLNTVTGDAHPALEVS